MKKLLPFILVLCPYFLAAQTSSTLFGSSVDFSTGIVTIVWDGNLNCESEFCDITTYDTLWVHSGPNDWSSVIWYNDPGAVKATNNGAGIFTFSIDVDDYYGLPITDINNIGIVFNIGNWSCAGRDTSHISYSYCDDLFLYTADFQGDCLAPSILNSSLDLVNSKVELIWNPTVEADAYTIQARKTDNFFLRVQTGSLVNNKTFNISGLPSGEYNWRVRSDCGSVRSAWSAVAAFDIPVTNCGIVTDIDGNIYNSVQIGTQCWMTENLKVTHYPDGTPIPQVSSPSNWDALSADDKAYCYYDNDLANKHTYGNLYTWAGVMNGAASSNSVPSGIQGPCPEGWHVPSDTEWDILVDYLGGQLIAGGALKSTSLWNLPNPSTNSSGFSALPGGDRWSTGVFSSLGDFGYFWSSRDYSAATSWARSLNYSNNFVDRFSGAIKETGYSCRCIKNPEAEGGSRMDGKIKTVDWEVYPNPTKDLLIFEGKIGSPSELTLEIIDMTGRTILMEKIDAEGSFKKSLDVSDLSAGIYLYIIETSQEAIMDRFVKE